MPYVPGKKDDKSIDREVLDAAVEQLAADVVARVTNNLSLIRVYRSTFLKIARFLRTDLVYRRILWFFGLSAPYSAIGCVSDAETNLARKILEVGAVYNYEGAFLGELNYAITRLIQRVPQLMVAQGDWVDEFRYWVYATTVEALTYTSYKTRNLGIGISGVFEDIKDEYKRRVNTAYEAKQILAFGDCYDTPYYTRLIEVVDESGALIGHQEVMLKRSDATRNSDVLEFRFIAKKK